MHTDGLVPSEAQLLLAYFDQDDGNEKKKLRTKEKVDEYRIFEIGR
jgi:hypothetical protein